MSFLHGFFLPVELTAPRSTDELELQSSSARLDEGEGRTWAGSAIAEALALLERPPRDASSSARSRGF